MIFDAHNKIVQLCVQGMDLEGQGKPAEAYELFMRAWSEANNDFDKLTAAHYVARHQSSVANKLEWDKIALESAMKINDENIKESYSSLYLNIGKCYEDLNDFNGAKSNYQLALHYTNYLPDGGYGSMIKSGIMNGLERVNNY